MKTSSAVAFRRPEAVSPTDAAKYAARLISFYRKDDVGDPEVFAAGMIAVMGLYPANVLREVVSPTVGIPRRLKFLPSIAEVSEACEAICVRIATEERKAAQPEPDRAPETTPEQRARMRDRFASLMADLNKGKAESALEGRP